MRLLQAAFDADFYRTQPGAPNRTSARSLLRHYLREGWRQGLDPNPDFSTLAYLGAYTDVSNAGVNPFVHYIRYGRAEGRSPKPVHSNASALATLREHFDEAFYREQAPQLQKATLEQLVLDYHTAGWRKGRDPVRWFSTNAYLKTHHDVRTRGIDPFLHYLTEGRLAGRKTHPAAPRAWGDLSQTQINQLHQFFDIETYCAQLNAEEAGDVGLASPIDEALAHYITKGWKEGYDPGPGFSTRDYLNAYSDTHGVCPLVHFLLHPHLTPRRPRAEAPLWLGYVPDCHPLPQYTFPLPSDDASTPRPSTPRITTGQTLDLHWVVPDFARGGGGHMTIFRMIRHLEGFGHRCTIWIDRPIHHSTAQDAYDDIIRYFQCVAAEVRFLEDGFEQASGDAIIATGWATAYHVQAARGFARRFYFVQDYEPFFYPTGTERYLAEQTYTFDLACICASPWLETKLRTEYKLWTRGFHLAYDPAVYHIRRNSSDFVLRLTEASPRHKIAVYAREQTQRRYVHLAVMALTELGRLRDDIEVHFFGQKDLSFQNCNFRAFNHGVLSEADLAQLYNECDLALCFSGTNYSLVPQEMMACGLPLIELDGESTRAIFPEDVVALAGPDPRDIAARIAALLDSPEERASQVKAAHSWVKQFSWEDSARVIEDALYEGLGAEQDQTLETPEVVRPRDLVMDVVIPTWNGMGEIEHVIDALRHQTYAKALQIHCIDSSSTDGTTDWLRAQSDIALTVIPQSEFQHGRTRNLGASLGNAPLIGFLTQDAIPAGSNWADDLLRMMRHYPEAAGVFGRHIPYPHHCLYVRQEIDRHFANLAQRPLAVSRATDPARWESGDTSWRQFLHFYSDNNSAMRRSVWREIPYPEIDYGEDQVWARDVIEAGHTKLYAPTATVWHSHDYSPEESYARALIEGDFFYTQFGYQLGPETDAALQTQLDHAAQNLASWGRHHRQAPAEIDRQHAILHQKLLGWRDGRRQAMARLL
ncbi:glycosyltransferase [Roseibaca sp. Y0-43]|nr:glycosyltransferase [Roseibaca sp. Y0-43]